MQPAYYENFKEIKKKIWSMLDDAVTNRSSQFRIPVFICGDQSDFDGRIVVLRKSDQTNNLVQFHSDIRSDKIPKLKNNTNASMLFYDKEEKIQVRLKEILRKLKITTIIVTHDSYEAFYLGSKCGIILNQELKQFDDPYKVYHFPNSVEVVNFLNRGILIPAKVTSQTTLENDELGIIEGRFIKNYPIGANVKLLLQPEDLEHDDNSNLKLEVVDRKFRGTNFIYTLKTLSEKLIPVLVNTHHHEIHEIHDKFGIKRPIRLEHIVCF